MKSFLTFSSYSLNESSTFLCSLDENKLVVSHNDSILLKIKLNETTEFLYHPTHFFCIIQRDSFYKFSSEQGELIQPFIQFLQNTFQNSFQNTFYVELVKKIGSGSSSSVYLASSKKGELFALKLYQNKQKNSERILIDLFDHPLIIKNIIYSGSDYFLCLEYLPCGSIADLLHKNKKISLEKSRNLICEVIIALNEIHKKNIIYRDIKSENILVTSDGHIKLIDFGLALKSEEQVKGLVGTSKYLSPEVIKKDFYDQKADWWSVGILLYEMIFGIPPFYSRNEEQLFYKIQNKDVIFPPQCNSSLKSFICGLLCKNPNERFGYSEIKNHSFFQGMKFEDFSEKKSIMNQEH
jgi:serine/threonine protein kinase